MTQLLRIRQVHKESGLSSEVFTRQEVDLPKHIASFDIIIRGIIDWKAATSRGSGSSAGLLHDYISLVDPSLSEACSVSWPTADLDSWACRTRGLLSTDSLTDYKVKVTESFLRIEPRVSHR